MSLSITKADVVPIHFFMSSSDTGSNNTVTVPNGKVLIIDQIQCSTDPITFQITYSNSQSGIISNSGLSTIRYENPVVNRMVTLDKPIRVGGISGTWRIRNATGSLVTVHGLAIDAEDLFASSPVEIDNFSLLGGQQALAQLRMKKKRQVRFEAERSDDLQNWQSLSLVSVDPNQQDPLLFDLVTPTLTEKEFFRFNARIRPSWAKDS
ncbi:MAG: hypothetical protein AAGC74_13885 [Verrucomicrobiota bacterium]